MCKVLLHTLKLPSNLPLEHNSHSMSANAPSGYAFKDMGSQWASLGNHWKNAFNSCWSGHKSIGWKQTVTYNEMDTNCSWAGLLWSPHHVCVCIGLSSKRHVVSSQVGCTYTTQLLYNHGKPRVCFLLPCTITKMRMSMSSAVSQAPPPTTYFLFYQVR